MTARLSPQPTPTGRGRLYQTQPYQVPGFSNSRPLTIYLPPGYDASGKRYPIAYMFDGQNIFGDEGSYCGGWHLHDALDKRARRGWTVPVVVGIHHGGPTRMEELCPFMIEGKQGRGAAFLEWVLGPLGAELERDLRVLTGPEHTMIGGSSLGGLLSLYAWIRYPEVFGKVLSLSPSLWVDPQMMCRLALQADLPTSAKVYFDAGAYEQRTLVACNEMARTLGQKGFTPLQSMMWRPDPNGYHSEADWRRRLPKALHFLYGTGPSKPSTPISG